MCLIAPLPPQALHWAAKGGDEACIRSLIKAGMDVFQGDRGGETPLHIAAAMKHCGGMRAILQAGADPKAHNMRGETPMDLAASEGAREVLRAWEACFGGVAPADLLYIRAAVSGALAVTVDAALVGAFGLVKSEAAPQEADWKAGVGTYESMLKSRRGNTRTLRTKSSGSAASRTSSSALRRGESGGGSPESPGGTRRKRTAKSVRFGGDDEEEEDPSAAWPGSEAWGGLDASPFPPSLSRPQTVYTSLTKDDIGRPLSSPWFLPPRPATVSYQRLSPRLRPRRQAAYRGTGSALDLQMLKVEWAANSPLARTRPASKAETQEEALNEVLASYGSYRGTDRLCSPL